MKRRAYLVTAAAATLGGCSALSDTDPSNDDDDDADDADTDGSSDETIDEEPGSFDQFADLSMWEVMEGSLELDTERAYVGEQSGRMEATESEQRVMIKRRFEQPRDLSNEFPALALASDRDVSPFVQLTDSDGNRLLLRTDVASGLPLIHHNPGVVDTEGEPDLSSVEHVKISAWVGDGDSATVWCDDLHFVPRPDTGRVLLQIHGGRESTLSRARSALSDYDFPATAFVPTEYVGGADYASRSQLEALQSEGWTIASHGTTGSGLAGQSESAQRDSIQGGIEWLEENGFGDGASYFAYPLDRYDETTMRLVEEHHDLGFISGHTGHADLLNPALTPRAVGPSAEEATQLLDRAARFNTIVTLSYADLSGTSGLAFERTLSSLSELESAGDLEVVGPDDIASNHVYEE